MIKISACAWSLPGEARGLLRRLRCAGFDLVDYRPPGWRYLQPAELAGGTGISLACAGISNVVMPPDLGLATLAGPEAGRVLPYFAGAMERAAALGAEAVYMVTPAQRLADDSHYMRSIRRLADAASAAGLKLCIEPHPGRALSTCAEALEFVRAADHADLYVLIDLGHTLITGENPAGAVAAAGDRLGYVHIDDNDGQSDLHLPLFRGVLTPSIATAFLDSLADTGYSGAIGIELDSSLPNPFTSLVSARDFVAGWAARRVL